MHRALSHTVAATFPGNKSLEPLLEDIKHVFAVGPRDESLNMNKIIKGFLGFCVIWLPVACSGSLSDVQYVDRAQDYLDQGDLNAATIELKNALEQNKENAQARMLLGEVYLEVGNAASAEKELRRASELGVADGAILPPLARALLMQGKYEELQALSLENLTAMDQKALVLAAQGLGKLVQGEVDAGTELIDQAVSLDPQSVYADVAKARQLAANQKYDLARKELDRVFELDANYAPAWNLLGFLEESDKNLAEAEAAYTKAAENRADNLEDLLKRATVRIQQKKYEAAQKDIDVLKNRAPQNTGVNYAQGLVYFHTNRLPEAKEAFDLTLGGNNRYPQALFFLSHIHLALGNRGQAEDYGNQFLAAVPNSISGRKLMATIELGNREYAAAEELIRPVVAYKGDDVAALNLLASSLLKQNKVDEAIVLLEKAASLQPDSASAQLRLGAGLLAGGKQAAGVEGIEKALEMDPRLQLAHAMLVNYYLDQKDFDKALKAAEAYRDQYPDSTAPYNLIGRVQIASGQETDAAKAFTRAREIAPGDPEASYNLAVLAITKQAYQEARGYYEDVLQYHEDNLLALVKLAALDALENKQQAMLEHLQQAVAAHPKVVWPRVLLARYYMTQGEPGKVTALMLELSKKQRQAPDVLEVMALSQLAQKQYYEAKYSLEQLIERQPDSAQAHFLLAQAHAGLGELAELKGELERTVGLAPRDFAARLALARMLLLVGQKEMVTEHLAVLNELSPEHPDVLRLKASLARAQGDRETASALLEDVFETSPSTASMLSVARQKWTMGDHAGALALQEQWTAEHPDDLAATLALASAYSREDQIDTAIIQFQQILEKEEQNVVALNDLAWHLRNKEPAKALEYAERAAELAPESAAVMDTFAVVLMKNGDFERAKRQIERVLVKKPKDPAFRYHGAMIDAAAGDKASALEALQSLLAEGGNFSEKAEAQQLLAELQAGG